MLAGPSAYVTRILVRRPQDAGRFSGNVEVQIFNATSGVDIGGPQDFVSMAERGDAWIGVTSKALTAKALQRFDPERYAPLSWAAPVACRCEFPSMMAGGEDELRRRAAAGALGSSPDTEDGLIWDMLAQLGVLLKSEERRRLLPGFSKPWLFMVGGSQSAIYMRTWVSAFHKRCRLPDDAPIYDGYFATVGPMMARINQCSSDVPVDDPRQHMPYDIDVPFVSMCSEAELWGAWRTRQPNVVKPSAGVISYEVPGGGHLAGDVPGGNPDMLMAIASAADMARTGIQLPAIALMPPVDFPWGPAMRGALHNLKHWVREHAPPPEAPPIEINAAGEVARDRHGNALGGLRMPYIDVPTAAFQGSTSMGGALTVTKRAFTPEELRALYPTHADYVGQFSAATDRMVAERWISARDAEMMKAAAEATPARSNAFPSRPSATCATTHVQNRTNARSFLVVPPKCVDRVTPNDMWGKTMQRREFGLAVGGLVLSGAGLSACATDGATAGASLPEVIGPVPVTPTSHPFLTARERCEAVGYVEEEYFLKGQANVYAWGEGHNVNVVAGPGDYVTRLLVRRPRDAARFSGNVDVAILNASIGVDLGGPQDFVSMVEEGDVWIGITSKALTAKALQRFDPERYAQLSWAAPGAARCEFPSIIPAYMLGGEENLRRYAAMGAPGSSPETEDGLIWDMLGQLGLLLKSDARNRILPGFTKPWLYMTGGSQSGIYMRTWVSGFHKRYRTPDGGPAYDGYFATVGPMQSRIHQCAADVALEDPLQKMPVDLDVPFISMCSEAEIWGTRHTRQPNVITPTAGVLLYDVPGGGHNAGDLPGANPDMMMALASPADIARAGIQMPAMAQMPPADFPWGPASRGAYRNLKLWVREHTPPPEAPLIELDGALQVVRDRHGNARGGLRMPYIDVPTAAFRGETSIAAGANLMVAKRAFTPDELRALYPTHAAYVAQFSAATDRLVAARFISARDATLMKAAAEAAPVPG